MNDPISDIVARRLQNTGRPAVANEDDISSLIIFDSQQDFIIFQQTENADADYKVISTGGIVEL